MHVAKFSENVVRPNGKNAKYASRVCDKFTKRNITDLLNEYFIERSVHKVPASLDCYKQTIINDGNILPTGC